MAGGNPPVAICDGRPVGCDSRSERMIGGFLAAGCVGVCGCFSSLFGKNGVRCAVLVPVCALRGCS